MARGKGPSKRPVSKPRDPLEKVGIITPSGLFGDLFGDPDLAAASPEDRAFVEDVRERLRDPEPVLIEGLVLMARKASEVLVAHDCEVRAVEHPSAMPPTEIAPREVLLWRAGGSFHTLGGAMMEIGKVLMRLRWTEADGPHLV